jgi:hypothetical protein
MFILGTKKFDLADHFLFVTTDCGAKSSVTTPDRNESLKKGKQPAFFYILFTSTQRMLVAF